MKLGSVSTDNMEECRVIVRVKATVQLSHKRRLVNEGKAAYRVDVAEVVLD